MEIEFVSSSPTHVGRWVQPCRGRTVIRRPLLVTPTLEPETDDIVAVKLLIQAQEIVELANNTTTEYVSFFFLYYNCDVVSKFNVGLKYLLELGLSKPEFYGDSV